MTADAPAGGPVADRPVADRPVVDVPVVDVHCHVIAPAMLTTAVPAQWRPAIRRSGGRPVVEFRGRELSSAVAEFCDVGVMLAQAADAGVTHLLLSPWIMLAPAAGPAREAARVCRVQNESLAGLAARHRDAVRVLGAVPLQDPIAAAVELEYLMRLPGVAGAEVPAHAGGYYLGDRRFRPFWEAAAGTGALIFVHPTTTGFGPSALAEHYLWNSVGNPLETAISAAHLVTAGVLEHLPSLKVLLAHGGGGLPALRGRLRRAFEVRPEAAAACRAGPEASLRRLYYDSLTHDPAVLAGLVAFAGAGQVLLGSDRPFDMGAPDPAGDVAAAGLSPADERLVLGGSAQRLLGLADA
jgi:aminocarboxymuconate-semialdehyde decarboxylase